MTGVSILIPAYKAAHLRHAIASALTQEMALPSEIIVNDDTADGALGAIVAEFRDARIRYHRTTGRTGAVANCAALWNMARHDLIKFVFDDDVLLPHALPELLGAVERHPDAAIWFGRRNIIDAAGRITTDAPRQSATAGEVTVDPRRLANGMLSRIVNPIGEFSNTLMNRAAGLTAEDFTRYRGFELRILGDAALYLAAAWRGGAIALDRAVSSFRRHADQQSSAAANPLFAFGLGEWELMLRGEFAAGRIDRDSAMAGTARLAQIYAGWRARLPALALLADGLPALGGAIEADRRDLLECDFPDRWATFSQAILDTRGR